MAASLMAVKSDWLNADTLTHTNSNSYTGTVTGTVSHCIDWTGDWWGGTYYYPVYQPSPARPIKLTLSEVERLRKAAKADDKLKLILQKFTGQIEITVDFE
jgi:hypothetical protein